MFKIFKETKGIFIPPKKNFYFGKIKFGTPYFSPMNFNPSIISIRKLIKSENYGNCLDENGRRIGIGRWYENLPMVRRGKYWVKKIFGNYFYIEVGYPIMIHKGDLGWKDKYDSPRYEWSPSFQIYFFCWQFCIWWNSPNENNDLYYEMMLHYLYYADKDIIKARNTWSWINSKTKESTWNDDFVKINVSNKKLLIEKIR